MKPDHRLYPPTPDWKLLLAILVGALLCTLLLVGAPFLGHDWLAYFAVQPNGIFPQRPNPSYPPWVLHVVLRPLITLPPYSGLAIVHGFTLAAVTLLTFRYARWTFPNSRIPALAAVLFVLFSPLPWMMLWLGQVDVLVLLGLATLPLGVPLLLGKLNTGIWALLGTRRDMLWSIGWVLLSFVLWGFWPLALTNNSIYLQPSSDQSIYHPVLMSWVTTHPIFALLGLAMLLFTNRDPLRLIAAGSFISPYMMAYHYYVLLPALGRTSGWRQCVLWLASLVPLLVAGIPTTPVKIAALSFPLLVWLLLAPALRPRAILSDPDTLVNRALRVGREMRAWAFNRRER